MLEQDLIAIEKNNQNKSDVRRPIYEGQEEINKIASKVMRQAILPKITKDINQGRNFANLRQIYHSLILAKWFKEKFKQSFYRYYINQNNLTGIDLKDKTAKDQIYNLYIQAFQKGLYDCIKTEIEPVTNKKLKRRYFSGGITNLMAGTINSVPVGLRTLASSPARGKLKTVSAAVIGTLEYFQEKNYRGEIKDIEKIISKNL